VKAPPNPRIGWNFRAGCSTMACADGCWTARQCNPCTEAKRFSPPVTHALIGLDSLLPAAMTSIGPANAAVTPRADDLRNCRRVVLVSIAFSILFCNNDRL